MESQDKKNQFKCKCGTKVDGKMHTCPFKAEIWSDYDSKCNCCEACEHECAMDV